MAQLYKMKVLVLLTVSRSVINLISVVVNDMDLDALVITETWLTGNVSDQKLVGDVTPAGYSFHHAARIHQKDGGVGILLRDSLKCETHLRFQAKAFENYKLTFISGEKWPESSRFLQGIFGIC